MNADIGRAQWDLVQCARHLRDAIRDPDARRDIDDDMLDEALGEFMGIIGDLSTADKRDARERAAA